MTSLSLIFQWAPGCTKLNLFSLNPSSVNLILDQPRILEKKEKNSLLLHELYVNKAVIKKKKERKKSWGPWVTAILPSASACWCLLHLMEKCSCGHAHSGSASWSADRWGLGPLSRLVTTELQLLKQNGQKQEDSPIHQRLPMSKSSWWQVPSAKKNWSGQNSDRSSDSLLQKNQRSWDLWTEKPWEDSPGWRYLNRLLLIPPVLE